MFQGGYGEDTLFCDSNKWGVRCSQMEVPGQRTSTAAQPNLGDLMQTQKEGRSSNYISGMKIPKVTSTHHISD